MFRARGSQSSGADSSKSGSCCANQSIPLMAPAQLAGGASKNRSIPHTDNEPCWVEGNQAISENRMLDSHADSVGVQDSPLNRI